MGAHFGTEPGNDTGIHLVVLRAEKFALGKPLDSCRIHDTHQVTRIVEVRGQFVAIGTRRLHTDAGTVNPVFLEPEGELREALLGVGKNLVLQLFVDQ